MGFLKVNYDEAGGFELLPNGDYECMVSEVKVTESSTGKPMLKATLTIRDDIEQQGQKRKLFDNMVEQENMMWKFQQVAKAAQVPNDADIPSLSDFAAAIQYKPVRVTLGQRVYNGETQNQIKGWKESKYSDGADVNFNNLGDGGFEVNDDDLPF